MKRLVIRNVPMLISSHDKITVVMQDVYMGKERRGICELAALLMQFFYHFKTTLKCLEASV